MILEDEFGGFSMNNIFEQSFIWNNIQHFTEVLPHNSQILFACFCANQVIHLVPQEHQKVCKKAIEVALLFIDGKSTKEECKKAAASTADAAYATASAVAASAVDAAYAAAHAAYAAATYAAAHASDAAAYAASSNKEEIKQEQMNYLRELIINNLTEEEKDCWLLVASF